MKIKIRPLKYLENKSRLGPVKEILIDENRLEVIALPYRNDLRLELWFT